MNNKHNSLSILITGASGFIGKHFVRKLLKSGFELICFDLAFDIGFVSEFGSQLKMVQGNLSNAKQIEDLIISNRPDYIFHFAGSKSRTNLAEEFHSSFEVNYFGTLNLLKACIGIETIKKITILGTIDEYGNAVLPFKEKNMELPASAYGLSKLSATKLALIFFQQFNLPVVVFRPSIAYGPAQGEEMFLPALIISLLKHRPFKMTAGCQLRDFIYIDDLTEVLANSMNCDGLNGQVINIAFGKAIKLKEIALQIADIVGNHNDLKMGGVPYRKSEIMNYSVDISKAKRILHWKPSTSIQEGLGLTINYYREKLKE